MSTFIKPLPYVGRKPVSIERDGGDVVIIEGVRFDGDFFRTFGAPSMEVLYEMRRLEDGCVVLTVIKNTEEAKAFFEEIELKELHNA